MAILQDVAEKFIAWTKLKIHIHHKNEKEKSTLYFHEGQIWWAALGQNIGFEMNGKNDPFHRPVLVLKKYNEHMCFVLPLTTKIKDPVVWYQVTLSAIDSKTQAAVISQGRTMSTKRLLKKEGSIKRSELKKIRKEFCKQFE